ncbi:hypothetical protein INT45_000579 [Circinella minor]|uniref:Uncharacterized protein n=1 Tax=Circinella minor TaxID=1195481 RepID=A0A8H7SDP9_9FUNG|nr:hypothetical protein INT45_000579 [Circinella minor]
MKCDTSLKKQEQCYIVINGKRVEYRIEDSPSQRTIEPSVNLDVIGTSIDESMLQRLDANNTYLRLPKLVTRTDTEDVLQGANDLILLLTEQEHNFHHNLSVHCELQVFDNLTAQVKERDDKNGFGEEQKEENEHSNNELVKFVIEDLPWNMSENLLNDVTEDVFQGAYDLTILALRACDKVPLFPPSATYES